ncbi:hypothetical protein [Xanthomonas euvesicatoria]|uniref:hypothetical protein n=1 Tax=Xanthomonas euvesicatoria TaxID=456327 RepID=UPI001C48E4DD|nr:hypothetical protein [Xanthomonas euvesicatoria]MBV6885955.1 hypothetical protein [Xanthomonas campestris pv. euphorbiae]
MHTIELSKLVEQRLVLLQPERLEVIGLMRNGWEMALRVRPGLAPTCWLEKNGVGSGGESKSVDIETFNVLVDRGVFQVKNIGCRVNIYALSDAYCLADELSP